jgi:AAA+ ATPase superfamily predicted ATPase
MSRDDDLKRQIAIHTRRLQILKERQAVLGISADPSLLIEIEDIEATLTELQANLGEKAISTSDSISISDSAIVSISGQKLKNPYTFGVPVSSGEFFGREAELRLVFETLENVPYGQKQDMVVLGPRRIGKSSLLYHLVDLLTQSLDFVPVYVDLQNIKPRNTRLLFFEILEKIQEGFQRNSSLTTSPLPPFQALISRIQEKADRLSSLTTSPLPSFQTLTKEHIPADMEFYTFKKDLDSLNRAIADHKLPRLVLMFDEVELLIEFGGQDMLDWFRSLIQSSYYIIFVVAGSERLYSLTQDYGSPFYNIFKIIELHPLTYEAARTLVEEPARQIGLEISPGEVNKIVSYAGNSPYFIQGLCHYLVERLNQKGRSRVYPEDTDQVLSQSIEYFSGHFSYIWGGLSQVEQALLYTLAESKNPQTAEALLVRLPQLENLIRSRREQKELFERLVQQQILKVNRGRYQFIVLLFVDWILTRVDESVLRTGLDSSSAETPNLRAIRRLLSQAFDDVALTNFTLDYFPEVFDRFSRGMRKDEQINLLLDYTRRNSRQFDHLLSVLKKEVPQAYQAYIKDLPVSS